MCAMHLLPGRHVGPTVTRSCARSSRGEGEGFRSHRATPHPNDAYAPAAANGRRRHPVRNGCKPRDGFAPRPGVVGRRNADPRPRGNRARHRAPTLKSTGPVNREVRVRIPSGAPPRSIRGRSGTERPGKIASSSVGAPCLVERGVRRCDLPGRDQPGARVRRSRIPYGANRRGRVREWKRWGRSSAYAVAAEPAADRVVSGRDPLCNVCDLDAADCVQCGVHRCGTHDRGVSRGERAEDGCDEHRREGGTHALHGVTPFRPHDLGGRHGGRWRLTWSGRGMHVEPAKYPGIRIRVSAASTQRGPRSARVMARVPTAVTGWLPC